MRRQRQLDAPDLNCHDAQTGTARGLYRSGLDGWEKGVTNIFETDGLHLVIGAAAEGCS